MKHEPELYQHINLTAKNRFQGAKFIFQKLILLYNTIYYMFNATDTPVAPVNHKRSETVLPKMTTDQQLISAFTKQII